MSHQPNWQEYGLPVAKGTDKTVVEVHDGIYGKYDPVPCPTPSPLPTVKLDPTPFGSTK
jgi:hypothetical protein